MSLSSLPNAFTFLVFATCLGVIDCYYRSYSYYSYRYYRYSYSYYSYRSYSYYYYYSYSTTLTARQKGIVAGGVIGGLLAVFLFTACVVYCCVYRGRRTSGTVIATTSSSAAVIAGPQPTVGAPYDGAVSYNKPSDNLSYNQPPPPYNEVQNSATASNSSPAMVNVDSTSTVNLVKNEVTSQ